MKPYPMSAVPIVLSMINVILAGCFFHVSNPGPSIIHFGLGMYFIGLAITMEIHYGLLALKKREKDE